MQWNKTYFRLYPSQWAIITIMLIAVVAVGLSSGGDTEPPAEPEYTLVLRTDEETYNRGDIINITGYFFYGEDPVADQTIGLWINYTVPWVSQVDTNDEGYFQVTHVIGGFPPAMSYAVQAAASGVGTYNHTYFTLLPDGSGTVTEAIRR